MQGEAPNVLWLEDVMNDLFEALPNTGWNDKLALLYKLCSEKKVTVKTPVGQTERGNMPKIARWVMGTKSVLLFDRHDWQGVWSKSWAPLFVQELDECSCTQYGRWHAGIFYLWTRFHLIEYTHKHPYWAQKIRISYSRQNAIKCM